MSTTSFDDASNLVDISSATNGEQQEGATSTEHAERKTSLLDEPIDDFCDIKESETKSKSKKSKAKRLFKRAKSPISGAINKTTKEFKKLSNLPKHHHASPKSPSKSPSKENLTEEYSHLESRLSEKKSEEWLAFHQMQERIQQTVLKTQTSLHKYTSQSEDEDQKDEKGSKWTDFGDDTTLDPEELIDTSLNPAINISCDNTGTEFANQPLIDIARQHSDLDTTPIASVTPIAPASPINNRKSSMEDLIQTEENIQQPPKQAEADLLGFLDTSDVSNTTANVTASDLLSQDMLGLDSVLEPAAVSGDTSATSSSNQVLSGYSFSMSSSTDMPVSGQTQDPKSNMSDVIMFEKPIEEIQPFVQKEVGAPFVQKEVGAPFVQKDVGAPFIQKDVGAPFVQKDVGAPFVQEVGADNIMMSEESKPAVDLFGIDAAIDVVPVQPITDSVVPQAESSSIPDTFLIGDPLEPAVACHQVVPNIQEDKQNEPSAVTVSDEFASFDPMKSDASIVMPSTPSPSVGMFGASSSPVPFGISNQASGTGMQMYGSSPQSYGTNFGSVPASGTTQLDVLSKIKMMSSGSQPVSPARRQAPKPPTTDPFGFVKKVLKKPGEEGYEEDDGQYKSMAEVAKGKTQVNIELSEPDSVQETDNATDTNTVNNPFLTDSMTDDTLYTNEGFNGSAAEVFGLEPGSIKIDGTNDDILNVGASDTKKPQWTDLNAVDNSGSAWDDTGAFDSVDTGFEQESAWDTAVTSDTKSSGDAWGTEPAASDTSVEGTSNPFQDDFSKLEEVPVIEQVGGTVNPFLSDDMTVSAPLVVTSHNPFLDIEPVIRDQSIDLLGAQSSMLSDSENFFADSVADVQQDIGVTDDIFDPFKVTAPKSGPAEPMGESKDAPDTLDIFSSVAASGDKQLVKPSADDDHGFMLEIKPASETRASESSGPAPILKPPPKPPKSPQPPRENPFDRDSPPEEDFAQFDVKEIEKPMAPPPKSISTDSTTTEEEEILEPLEPFLPKCEKEGFKLMLRYPTKKKIAGNRYWKNVFVKLHKQNDGPVIKVFSDAKDALPMQELPLQACYSLSDLSLQQYDQYGKIHTVKLQYIFYKERVGIKTDRIAPSIVKFKKKEKPKATMILDHSPQVSELLKFGGLDKTEVIDFVHEVEDALMNLDAHREKTLTYTKDEVTAEVHDEYMAELDKFGRVLTQTARVRIFTLCFLTGMPTVEIGLNDKRRRGKEVVGRSDIIPIKTEEWIRLEDVEFHCCVDKDEFEKTNNIKFRPLDACQFELLRYRVRLRENKELPLQLTIQQIFKHRTCEIRCDLLVTGYHSYSKKHGQFPCEDIEVRFPIPEVWIYMFRYERRFGYGSVHSTTRKPGKIKGLERLTMMAQGNLNQTLMEADVGTAKYEHVYRSVVWRIPRLPVRNQGAYTSHLLKLKLELGPHDDIPETFENYAFVEFNMPCSTVSQSQIRSVAVTNPNPPEKWVRSMARYEYRIEIEHLDEYPELMTIGSVYKEAASTPGSKVDEEPEPEERDPRLAVSDSDSSDTD